MRIRLVLTVLAVLSSAGCQTSADTSSQASFAQYEQTRASYISGILYAATAQPRHLTGIASLLDVQVITVSDSTGKEYLGFLTKKEKIRPGCNVEGKFVKVSRGVLFDARPFIPAEFLGWIRPDSGHGPGPPVQAMTEPLNLAGVAAVFNIQVAVVPGFNGGTLLAVFHKTSRIRVKNQIPDNLDVFVSSKLFYKARKFLP